MPTDASHELTDDHLAHVEEYMRGVVQGNERPKGLPLHWLVLTFPEIRDTGLWERWARIGKLLLEGSRVGELEDAQRRMSVDAEHGRRCMALAAMWRSLELGTVSTYMNYVEELAAPPSEPEFQLDPRVRLKAAVLLLNRFEPGKWTSSGKAPDADEVAEPAPASARVRALSRERLDGLDDEQRAAVTKILEDEAEAAQAREDREKRLQKIIEGGE